MSCGVGHRRGLDLMLLWLWRRPAAAAPIRHLAWELPYAAGAALKRKTKTKKTKKGKERRGGKSQPISGESQCVAKEAASWAVDRRMKEELWEGDDSWFWPRTQSLARSLFFFFPGRAWGMWKFPGQGSNPCHSSNLGCCNNNTRSLADCTTRELHMELFSFLMIFAFAIIVGLQYSVSFLLYSKGTQSYTHMCIYIYIYPFPHMILHHTLRFLK